MRTIFLLSFIIMYYYSFTQTNYISKVWVADLGNGNYKNPILHADYSDPDAIRVGNDYYMIASSFESVPGIPILHSKDLINWSIIAHALPNQVPIHHFSSPKHGEGVWAPSIRYFKGEFYIYYPDPDFGIYLIKAKNIKGPWSTPILVEAGKGLIDPCPLWDDDGKLYLVHAFAGSRAGIKSIIVIKPLNKDGTKVIGQGSIVYDGHELDPTIEGPKLYKRNGWYYIFAPAGGVTTGWQVVLRAKNIYGPYERRVVLHQGKTVINGPHQGAWVNTPSGEDWFLHFQDKDAYGRVVHLQPMRWKNDWPIIGTDKDKDGIGEPVLTYKKPNVGKNYPLDTPQESDEFSAASLGLQWQWMANPKPYWYFLDKAKNNLRLYAIPHSNNSNLWFASNNLLQKFPAPEFMVTTKLKFYANAKLENERAGICILGLNYATLFITKKSDGFYLVYGSCNNAEKNNNELQEIITPLADSTIYLRIKVKQDALCTFSYSINGKDFLEIQHPSFKAVAGRWVGARFGIYANGTKQINDTGYADFDWVRIE